MPKEYSWTPVPYIEPANPQLQVGHNQKVMSEVLSSEKKNTSVHFFCSIAALIVTMVTVLEMTTNLYIPYE